MDQEVETDRALDDLLAEISEKLHAGQSVDLEAYVRQSPTHAAQLSKMFPAMLSLVDLGHTPPASGAGDVASDSVSARIQGTLGDFRILREIGRGGMGIVYEAEQISLGRQVALKVLPFASVLDDKRLQRFKNEARAAAALDHPHIVKVHSVSCQQGVHYYAMQYIEGQTLASVIAELRRLPPPGTPATGGGAADSPVRDLTAGRLADSADKLGRADPAGRPKPSATDTCSVHADTQRQAQAGISTEGSIRSRGFFRSAATLGIQAARALEHAHEMGIVHRDVKPANLLVDDRGHLWIADFGLATTQTEGNLTMTGELPGTLRYMSPEQVGGNRRVLDHRTDIYSLGVTLYELLTLQPAFGSDDRQQLMRQIADKQPRQPRRINHAIPPDLETIVLKATAKEAGSRYASAGAMAADLQRFLDDRPVQARRSRPLEQTWRWCRRNPLVAGLASALMLAVVLTGIGGVVAAFTFSAQRDAALENLKRAERAEAEAKERLWDAYLRQAQANRRSGRMGQRFDGLDAVRAAAALRTSRALRNEAVACMALPDIQIEREWDLENAWIVDFSPELDRYVRSNNHDEASVRAVDDGRELLRLPSAHRRQFRIRFSPNGRLLAEKHATAAGAECRVWDVDRNRVVLEKPVVTPGLHRFSPDSQTIALAEPDGSIRLYDLSTGRPALTLSPQSGATCGCFHPEGTQLAVYKRYGGSVRVIDLRTGNPVRDLAVPHGVRYACWCRDGRRLALAGLDNNAYVWDVDSGKQTAVLRGHQGEVTELAVHPLDGMLVSSSWDNTTKFWDPATGRQLLSADEWYVRFSPDGHQLAFRARDRVGIWKVATGRECIALCESPSHGNGPWHAAFNPDASLLASAGDDGVRLWDVHARQVVAHLAVGPSHTAAFHPSDGSLITSSQSGLRRWPVTSGRLQGTIRVGPPEIIAEPAGVTRALAAVSGDGRYVAAIGESGRVVRYCLDPAEEEHVDFDVPNGDAHCLAISPHGRWIAVGVQHKVMLWDAEQRELVTDCLTRGDEPHLVFSPDGQWLVTSTHEEHRFWRVGSWQAGLGIPHPDVSRWKPMAFSPCGKMLATGKTASLVQLLDAATGEELVTLEPQHPAPLFGLTFSPDGNRLAALSSNHTIQIWDLGHIRRQLTPMGLDWQSEPVSDRTTPVPVSSRPLSVEVLPADRDDQ